VRGREESRVLIAGEQRAAAIACCTRESQREGEVAQEREREIKSACYYLVLSIPNKGWLRGCLDGGD
jgi:hypothetical protein